LESHTGRQSCLTAYREQTCASRKGRSPKYLDPLDSRLNHPRCEALSTPSRYSPSKQLVKNRNAPIGSPSAKPNWFVRNWRGELSLGTAYWINFVLIANTASPLTIQAFMQSGPFRHSLRMAAVARMTLLAMQYCLWIWGVAGVLRSANRHAGRGGSRFWANAARVMICLAILFSTVRIATSDIPGLRELGAIATGHDRMPKVWIVKTGDPTSIWLQGLIGTGSAQEVVDALNAQPTVTKVILSSQGGRAAEAEAIAALVKQRHLDTVVRADCSSACTYILLAGRHRSAEYPTAIGFHQPTFPGTTFLGQLQINRRMIEYYRSAGLPEAFIEHIMSTSPHTLWYPSPAELVDAGVLSEF
jgi:hypothetical protein